jgi:hypothetical protein
MPSARRKQLAIGCLLLVPAILCGQTAESKTAPDQHGIPVGLDAYREWAKWPNQRIGMRAYMRSTYDRAGGNEGADASHFLYQLTSAFNVTLDIEGAGILVFSRFNHWHGSPWHFAVDGADNIVRETSTADPLHPNPSSVFLPQAPFPPPLNYTWTTTKGADLIWSPIAFKRSLQLAYSRTHYGTGYYIYDQFVPGTPLSQPLVPWTESTVPGGDVLDLISRAGADIAPKAGATQIEGRVDVPASGAAVVATLTKKAVIRVLTFSIPRSQATAFQNVHLRITWDKRAYPSIDTPISLFYGAGTLYNRTQREYLVKAFPVNIRFTPSQIYLACYFPMPFFRSARIELAGAGKQVSGVQWYIRTLPLRESPDRLAYFHATYRDTPTPTPGKDLILLDTRGEEGANAWSGSLVGTSFIFSHAANLTTLEGDPRFFFDDSRTPQAQGTGTEEWAGGGDYWGGENMTLPFAGHPVGARNAKSAKSDEDEIESAYRFLLGDLMPFGKNALICLEHGGTDGSREHYETIAYWYGLPAPSLVETDELQIGDAASERAHNYSSIGGPAPYTIVSRYELGVDTVEGKVIFPPERDRGRITKDTSEFTLRLRPGNLGVLLRRKLDYSYPDQKAEVYVSGTRTPRWKLAGIWYLAGSNQCVYSNPKEELGAAEPVVETSNRLFRDDEFLISRELTRHERAIRVRIKVIPVNRPLLPGRPVRNQAWSEIKYTAYCFVKPRFRR